MKAIEDATNKICKTETRHSLLVQMPEFFTSELLMPHVKEFTSSHKDIDLNIEGLGVEQEMNSDADITVVLTRKTPKARKVARLFPIRYVPVCNQTKIDQDQTGDRHALRGRRARQPVPTNPRPISRDGHAAEHDHFRSRIRRG